MEEQNEYLERLATMSQEDVRELTIQGDDEFCAYGRLDISYSMLKMLEDNFLGDYFMLAHAKLWNQANKVHDEMFKLYSMLAEHFHNVST